MACLIDSRTETVRLIEYLCHACGQTAADATTHSDRHRRWLCPCGQSWTGGEWGKPHIMQAITDRSPALGCAVDRVLVGKGAYENFRCSKCQWWKKDPEATNDEPAWGVCEFKHDRLYVQIPGIGPGDGKSWSRADFACVEFNPAGFA